jgi:hypothetical protein
MSLHLGDVPVELCALLRVEYRADRGNALFTALRHFRAARGHRGRVTRLTRLGAGTCPISLLTELLPCVRAQLLDARFLVLGQRDAAKEHRFCSTALAARAAPESAVRLSGTGALWALGSLRARYADRGQ